MRTAAEESSGFAVSDLQQKFTVRQSNSFEVEITSQGNDIIYHFWPPGDDRQFRALFETKLEDAFKAVLPPSADVRADYTSQRESMALHSQGAGPVPMKDRERKFIVPRETYYVRVKDGLKYPLSEHYLMDVVLRKLESMFTN